MSNKCHISNSHSQDAHITCFYPCRGY